MSQKFLLSVDSKDAPGKLKLTTVTFDTEFVDKGDPAFAGREYMLLDRDHPFVKQIHELFK